MGMNPFSLIKTADFSDEVFTGKNIYGLGILPFEGALCDGSGSSSFLKLLLEINISFKIY